MALPHLPADRSADGCATMRAFHIAQGGAHAANRARDCALTWTAGDMYGNRVTQRNLMWLPTVAGNNNNNNNNRRRIVMQRILLGSACCVAVLLGALAAPAVAQDITIAGILPQTGPSAAVGLQERQGVQYAVDEINAAGGLRGHMVRVNFDDNQTKPDQSVLAFNREVDLNNVPVIITGFSVPTLAIAPLATRKKVVLINPAAQADGLGTASPYLFNTMPLTRDETEVLAHYLVRTLHVKTAGILYENSAPGIDGRNDFTANFKKFGGEIVSDDPIQPGDTNFRPMILKAASAKPDVEFLNVVSGDTLPQFNEQVTQQHGFPIVVGTTFATPAMGQPGSDGWYYTAIRGSLPAGVEQAMNAKLGFTTMNVYTREYYNATKNIFAVVAASLIDAKKPVTGENFRDELLRLKTFEGVAKITFVGNTAVRNIDILQVQKGVGVKVAEGTVGQD
jgi:branched-chain amino acid transport system substrate-binding protein